MLKLSELTVLDEKKLLYIERFENECFELIPKTFVKTVEGYMLNHSHTDEIFIAEESPIEFRLQEILKMIEDENVLGEGWTEKIMNELEDKEIDNFETKINAVLKKHKNYVAGEYVDNDIY
ncbi:MAG: hypothetical protein Q4P35_04040 [Clostridia bacterium]|nr:hypothetical protein [Clostridia bacterium]